MARTPAALVALALMAIGTLGATTATIGASTPPQTTAWVATGASITDPGATVTPVNVQTRTVGTPVHVGTLPSAMAFTPDDSELLAVSQGTDKLHEVNLAAHKDVRSVLVGVEPDAVAVTPSEPHHTEDALVANLTANSVSVVNLRTWKVTKTIAVGTEPVAIAVTATGANTWVALVADFGSDQVTPISSSTLQAGPPIAVGSEPETIAFSAEQALVGDFGDDTVTPISASTLQPGAAIPLPVNPTDIVVATGQQQAFISGGSSIVPFNLTTMAAGAAIALPAPAAGLALSHHDGTAWVTLENGSLVSVTLATGQVGRPIRLHGHPTAVVVGPG